VSDTTKIVLAAEKQKKVKWNEEDTNDCNHVGMLLLLYLYYSKVTISEIWVVR
jgi:hypothetical protein